MWLHESFTTYSEAVYVEGIWGKLKAVEYINYHSKNVRNKQPMRGPDGVNFDDHGTEIYYKGSLMLNTLRFCINDDLLWWMMIKTFALRYRQSNVTTDDFINLVNETTKKDYTPFFDQYLNYAKLPVFEYSLTKKGKGHILRYRWLADAEGFNMPLDVGGSEKPIRIYPTTNWQTLKIPRGAFEKFSIARNRFYIDVKPL
jgi:aminopeptidase N